LTVAQIFDSEGVKRKIFQTKELRRIFADYVFNELWKLDIDYLVAVDGSQGPLWESAGAIYVAERDRLGPRRIPLVIKPTHRKVRDVRGTRPSKYHYLYSLTEEIWPW
jgi:hypothetical protein